VQSLVPKQSICKDTTSLLESFHPLQEETMKISQFTITIQLQSVARTKRGALQTLMKIPLKNRIPTTVWLISIVFSLLPTDTICCHNGSSYFPSRCLWRAAWRRRRFWRIGKFRSGRIWWQTIIFLRCS